MFENFPAPIPIYPVLLSKVMLCIFRCVISYNSKAPI